MRIFTQSMQGCEKNVKSRRVVYALAICSILASCNQPKDPTGVWACSIAYSGGPNPEGGQDIGITRLIAIGSTVPSMSLSKDSKSGGWIAISRPYTSIAIKGPIDDQTVDRVVLQSSRGSAGIGRDRQLSRMEKIGYRDDGRYFCFYSNLGWPKDPALPKLPPLSEQSKQECLLGFVSETTTYFIHPGLTMNLNYHAKVQNRRNINPERIASLPTYSEMGECRRLQTEVQYPSNPLVKLGDYY